MVRSDPAEEAVKKHLRHAIDRLHEDIEKVEFWTEALRSFSQPVPNYDPNATKFPLSGLPGENATLMSGYTRIGMRT